VEGIIYRYRTGVPWRDLPRSEFGPWQTVWKRHRRYAADGTWDRVLVNLLAMADADGQLDWTVSVDATINRAHQHATNTTRSGHRGLGRITRIRRWPSMNPQVMASDGLGAG
jgi:transposase